jgi:GNAT superfamily N-acetyltransferase
MPPDRSIHRADADDHAAVARLFDTALLETDSERLRRQLAGENGFVLVAGIKPPVGAIAVDAARQPLAGVDISPVRITAIAVQRRQRDRGIGSRLVIAAAERAAPRPLTARFDERVRPFYRACGFDTEPRDGRLWGIRWPG